MQINVNSAAVETSLSQLAATDFTPLLKQFGDYMLRSKELTFRGGGSPDGSWPPLAQSTLRRYSDSKRQAFVGSALKSHGESYRLGPNGERIVLRKAFHAPARQRGQKYLVARKILINTGRLKNSITYTVEAPRKVSIGTNLVYAAIHQYGGVTGRGYKSRIPARPYLVFRPEDRGRLQELADRFMRARIREARLG